MIHEGAIYIYICIYPLIILLLMVFNEYTINTTDLLNLVKL